MRPAADWYPTKEAATAAVQAAGYTEHEMTSESGDHGYGSREYYRTPDSPRNDHGWPWEVASVSQVEDRWATTYFGKDPA